MNKRGISAVVATVLIILITVAAVTIVWAAIIPMIQDNLDFSSLEGRVSVVTSGGYTVYDAVSKKASIQVKREADDGVMERVNIVFSIDGNTVSSSVIAPNSGAMKVYIFDMSVYGEPSEVSVAPIFVVGRNEKVGDVTSTASIVDGRVNSVTVVYDPGVEYFYEIPTGGLISWLKLDNDASDTMSDRSVTFNGVGFGPIDGRNAAEFSGAQNNYMYYSDSAELSPKENSFSYSLWLYPRSFSSLDNSGASRFLGHLNYCSAWETTPSCVWLLCQLRDNGALQFQGRGYGDDPIFNIQTPSGSVALNQWQHIVLVANRDEDMGYVYIDGSLVSNKTMGATGTFNMTNPLKVPNSYAETDGFMDDIMIYHRALSAKEVKGIYEIQKVSLVCAVADIGAFHPINNFQWRTA